MRVPVSRKERTIWNKVRLCDCCGRKVVHLRLPAWGSKTDMRWTIICYEKPWTGNPYYLPDVDVPHLSRMSARYLKRRDEEWEEAKERRDPFFSLD